MEPESSGLPTLFVLLDFIDLIILVLNGQALRVHAVEACRGVEV